MAFGWGKKIEERPNLFPCCLNGSFGRLAQECFELYEDHLDWVEVGAIGRQK